MPTYPLSSRDSEDLHRRFTYHAPRGSQPQRYQAIRELAFGLAKHICEECPNSRERSLALTKLDEAVMHANSAIARHEFSGPGGASSTTPPGEESSATPSVAPVTTQSVPSAPSANEQPSDEA